MNYTAVLNFSSYAMLPSSLGAAVRIYIMIKLQEMCNCALDSAKAKEMSKFHYLT